MHVHVHGRVRGCLTSLGFRLVRALAGQLDGVLRVTTSGGTRVQLTFAEAEAEKLGFPQ